jgi:hypothetical protein
LIRDEGAIQLSEALKFNSSLTLLNISGNILVVFISFLRNTENDIGPKGGMQLCEALKSNSSLTFLDISRNSTCPLFHSHSMQVIGLVMKEPSN